MRYKVTRIHNKVQFCEISVFVLIIHEDAELPEKPIMFWADGHQTVCLHLQTGSRKGQNGNTLIENWGTTWRRGKLTQRHNLVGKQCWAVGGVRYCSGKLEIFSKRSVRVFGTFEVSLVFLSWNKKERWGSKDKIKKKEINSWWQIN